MKVAFFIGSLNRGGAEMLLLDIFRKKKHATFEMILIYRNEGNLSGEFRATSVPMYRIKPGKSNLSYFRELRHLIKREKIDILHAQTLTNAVIAIFSTLFLRIKRVITFHGFYNTLKLSLFRQIVMWKMDAMIFVSKDLCDWYIKHTFLCPKNRCHVIYNGINFEKFKLRYPKPDFLEKTNNSNNVQLTMVGNFVRGRSHIVVCKSLKLLKEQGVRNFDFYFVGKQVDAEAGVYKECLKYCEENNLLDCVHFVGSRGDVPAILQHVDGFVYSTNHDSFGIAVVEAMASGTPVVVNDWRVMKEIIKEKDWATFFRTQDEYDCCEKIKQLIENIDSRKQLANKIKEDVKATYSIEKNIDNLTDVYQLCLS